MANFVNLSFERYNSIPVVVRESEITETQQKIREIKVNAEIL
jgi:hypothetical protein